MIEQGELFRAEVHWFHLFKAMIENGDVAKMGPYALTVYCVIKAHTNYTTGDSFPGIDKICEKSGISRAQVMRALTTLETMGYLGREKQGRKSHYTLRERVQINDPAGEPVAMASWDYLPSKIGGAVSELRRVLVTGDLAGARLIHIEKLIVNLNVNNGPGDQNIYNGITHPELDRASKVLQKHHKPVDNR